MIVYYNPNDDFYPRFAAAKYEDDELASLWYSFTGRDFHDSYDEDILSECHYRLLFRMDSSQDEEDIANRLIEKHPELLL